MAARPQSTSRRLVAILDDLATRPPPPVRGAPLDELRHLLEGAARTAVAGVPGDSLPLRAPKSAIADAIRCARFAAARRSVGFEAGSPDAQRRRRRGVAADVLVAHVLAGGVLDEPAAQIVADAWEARGDQDELAALAAMDDPERTGFDEDCAELATRLHADWMGLDWDRDGDGGDGGGARWWPRSQSTAAVALADGDVVITMRPDVELGGPAARLPPALIEVKATALAHDHSFDLNLYALGIALRDGLAPAAILHWSPGTGWVELPPVTIAVLESAARRAAHALVVLGELTRGETPVETPGAHCGWCPDAAVCPSADPTAQRDGELR